MPDTNLKSTVDFKCQTDNCTGLIKFPLELCFELDSLMSCPTCGKSYSFNCTFGADLRRLADMIKAVRAAEDLLGDAKVAVTVPGGTVKIPYTILLTKLNTMLSLDIEGRKTDVHLLFEPTASLLFK